VFVYVDNFLDFPVGGIVPAGWYDRDKAAWIPSDNGRVIQILAIENGQAVLDVDGSGQPASPEALAVLNITEEERSQLAALYPAGHSLWRTPVEHFTPWDCNWPYGPPEDAVAPEIEVRELEEKDDEPDCQPGSIIECQNQVVRQSIPVTGTPFSLNYRSDRVPGRQSAYHLTIPVSGSEALPASIARIVLEIWIAGQQHRYSFPAQPNQEHALIWDGNDGFGRRVQGSKQAKVRIGYVYKAVYYEPSSFANAFGVAGTNPIEGDRDNSEVILWQESQHWLGVDDARSLGLGGWSITPQHSYEPNAEVLWAGDGTRRSAGLVSDEIQTIAGTGAPGYSGDGGAAKTARLNVPYNMAIAPDGSLYFVDTENHRVRRIDSEGVITTVAGTGVSGYSGDGGDALSARLSGPWGVALGVDGSLYIADAYNHRIRHVDPQGIIRTVAGTGVEGYSGDGGPATQARLNRPLEVLVGEDGSLYIADRSNDRVRQVLPDGNIITLAGTGVAGFSGDGGPATLAHLNKPSAMAFASDGGLYVSDAFNNRIRHVGVSGQISTVAGSGQRGYSGDGGPAKEAWLNFPHGIRVGTDGSLYIADYGNARVRRVDPNGNISTVAGTGIEGFNGDGGPANEAMIGTLAVAIGQGGELYLAEIQYHRIRQITTRFGEQIGETLRLGDESGNEYHTFSARGRHLASHNSTSNALNYRFEYDQRGYLSHIEDAHGNLTHIERDSDGSPLAIIAPDGQRTTLILQDDGYLIAASNPVGETWTIGYSHDGLMSAFNKPKGQGSQYTYDHMGHLLTSSDPLGGGWSLSRTTLANGHEASMLSAEGRSIRYRVERDAQGELRRYNTHPDGTTTQRHQSQGKASTQVAADGTTTTTIYGPDPRFGMASSVAASQAITTPGAVAMQITGAKRTAHAHPLPLQLGQGSHRSDPPGRPNRGPELRQRWSPLRHAHRPWQLSVQLPSRYREIGKHYCPGWQQPGLHLGRLPAPVHQLEWGD